MGLRLRAAGGWELAVEWSQRHTKRYGGTAQRSAAQREYSHAVLTCCAHMLRCVRLGIQTVHSPKRGAL